MQLNRSRRAPAAARGSCRRPGLKLRMQPTWSVGSLFSMRLSAMPGCHCGRPLKSRIAAQTLSARRLDDAGGVDLDHDCAPITPGGSSPASLRAAAGRVGSPPAKSLHVAALMPISRSSWSTSGACARKRSAELTTLSAKLPPPCRRRRRGRRRRRVRRHAGS